MVHGVPGEFKHHGFKTAGWRGTPTRYVAERLIYPIADKILTKYFSNKMPPVHIRWDANGNPSSNKRRRLSTSSASSGTSSRYSNIFAPVSGRPNFHTPNRKRPNTKRSGARSNKLSDRKLGARSSTSALARVKRKRALHPKQPGKIKISKTLRKKINKVISGKTYHGYYQRIFSNTMVKPSDNYQSAGMIIGGTTDNLPGAFFTPTQVLDAASVLWNHKTAASNILFNDGPSAGAGGNLSYEATKVNVIKQWMTIKFRNDDQHNYYITLYACKLKSKTKVVTAKDALTIWTDNLTLENTSGINATSVNGATLYANPYMCKGFMDLFSVETTKIELQPGEEYVYHLSGASKIYDFRKLYGGDINQNYVQTKDEVQVFYTAMTHLNVSANGPGGRYAPAAVSTTVGAVVYEINEYYKLECPENVGTKFTNAGDIATAQVPADARNMYLHDKRDAYGIYNGMQAKSGAVVNVIIENPLSTFAN